MFKRQLEKIVLPAAAFVPILVAVIVLTSPDGLAQSDDASFDPRSI